MNDSDDVMISIYNTLLQLRYPHITKVESKDVESMILNGENRVYLLSWLLTEKMPCIRDQLERLKDAALEDQLFEYYSQIGICNNKEILLGKCSSKEQLPTLKLLLDFMRKVHVKPVGETDTNKTEETLMDIVKLYINDRASSLSVVKPKVSYIEAKKYFEEIGEDLLNNDHEDQIKISLSEDQPVQTDNGLADEDRNTLFNKEKERFIEAFQSISSWPMQSTDFDKDTADSICSDIKSICSDFHMLKKMLQAKSEISNTDLSKLPKTITPLNAIIENIVICNEELENLSMTNSID